MLPHTLTNYEAQKYYHSERKLNSVYLRRNLLKIKAGEYVINLDEFKSVGAHQIALHVNEIT